MLSRFSGSAFSVNFNNFRAQETRQVTANQDHGTTQISGGMTRRLALRGTAVAGLSVPLLAACGDDGEAGDASGTTATPSPEETTGGGGSSPSEGSGGGGGGFASTSDVPEGGGAIFADEGVVVTQPAAGEFKGFTNICTHQGCAVAEVTDTINCPCHGSMFSIEDGSPVGGPATKALPEMAIKVDGDAISLA
jgi:nitrite reductase/ring-hydroxylating ferredoxin subunit